MMRSAAAVPVTFLLLSAFLGTPQDAGAQVPAELAGGWLVSSWTAPDGTVNSQPQRGIFLFTQTGQYSIMYVPGNEARATYSGESMTDAEVLAAYRSLVANSGRYTVEGDVITYDAWVSKDPNYMSNWNMDTRANAQTMRYSIKDGMLHLEWLSGFSEGMKATLRRPSGG